MLNFSKRVFRKKPEQRSNSVLFEMFYCNSRILVCNEFRSESGQWSPNDRVIPFTEPVWVLVLLLDINNNHISNNIINTNIYY